MILHHTCCAHGQKNMQCSQVSSVAPQMEHKRLLLRFRLCHSNLVGSASYKINQAKKRTFSKTGIFQIQLLNCPSRLSWRLSHSKPYLTVYFPTYQPSHRNELSLESCMTRGPKLISFWTSFGRNVYRRFNCHSPSEKASFIRIFESTIWTKGIKLAMCSWDSQREYQKLLAPFPICIQNPSSRMAAALHVTKK